MTSVTRVPSKYQTAILDFVKNENGSAIVKARAGTGKTSTIEMIVEALRSGIEFVGVDTGAMMSRQVSVIIVAFNKAIEQELVKRGLPGRTFHSVGFSAVGKALYRVNRGKRSTVDARKVPNIIEQMFGRQFVASAALEKLVSLCKNHGYMPNVSDDLLSDLISHFDVEWDDDKNDPISEQDICQMARDVLAANNKVTNILDFDDMLYFVKVFNARLDTYDVILVDESQDTNPMRRELVKRMMHATSRVIAVGDDKQAIYGFTGASHDALDLIAEQFNCTTLPLSISYRCAASIIREAQRIVPDIEARENAPEGSVSRLPSFKRSDFVPTDLIICRNTAPLVQTAYKLIAARIPCKVMGREIGRGLTSLIKRLSRRNETLESLSIRLTDYATVEAGKAMAQKRETKAQAITDKCESICALIDSMSPDDIMGGIPRLIAIIDDMFSDTKNGVTTLATIHKSKGMEAPRVFILDESLMPSKYARQAWQIVQETNLRYVAITRALNDLVYVDSEKLTD